MLFWLWFDLVLKSYLFKQRLYFDLVYSATSPTTATSTTTTTTTYNNNKIQGLWRGTCWVFSCHCNQHKCLVLFLALVALEVDCAFQKHIFAFGFVLIYWEIVKSILWELLISLAQQLNIQFFPDNTEKNTWETVTATISISVPRLLLDIGILHNITVDMNFCTHSHRGNHLEFVLLKFDL